MEFNITAKIVPKDQPNADPRPFVVVFNEEQTRQLNCANWKQTDTLITPFIPEDHFLVAIEKIEAKV
jgi:hypothetical protein